MVKPGQPFRTGDHPWHGLRNMLAMVMLIDSAFTVHQKVKIFKAGYTKDRAFEEPGSRPA